ncbi:S41 family peptidase [Desertivirga arenae]|uniref:S41 family peptidase n=1 Tax=Desertivirga arenae TaxID=2810309 RepID=UPI001A9728EC|nr:S41 family peptidase [Pedobacter sp. SYSU D00823]
MQATTKKNLIISACYAGTVVLGMLIGPKFHNESSNSKNGTFIPFLGGRADKVEHVLNIIQENYVDPVRVDTLKDLAIAQILKRLDPHSSYLPPDEAQHFSENLDGNYYGIGVEYQILNDTVFVTAVHPEGPAYKAGIRPGDQVIKVADKVIAGTEITADRVVGLIKGRRGSEVKISLKRGAELKTVGVLRDKITISSLDAGYMMSDKVGYIKISRFGAHTDEDFILKGQQLKKAGMQGLILDLRGNGGGYLNAATGLADEFLPDKKLIVYTRGEHEPRTDYFATEKGIFEKGKLVVLIDENSASASEILAGAIQDLDRGTIIGRRSFGKGLVQEQFNFGDGSALNLTVARYFTPSGRSIQKPYGEGSDKYFEEVTQRFKNGELAGRHADSITDKHKTFKTSAGRPIYGGGGITPDVFVPIDTTAYNDLFFSLSAKGIITDFSYKHFGPEKSSGSLGEFLKEFVVSENDLGRFRAFALARKVEIDAKEFSHAKPAISLQIKALMARYYFGEEGFYKVKNLSDKTVAKALEVLNKAQINDRP